MDEIRRQVSRVRRRMNFQQFVANAAWVIFSVFLVTLIGLAIPKIWVLPVDAQLWTWGWLGGSSAAAILLAVFWTHFVRRHQIDAAIELDRRFGLKERVSSTLLMQAHELETEAGRALVGDAERRVKQVDVRDRFSVVWNWRLLAPLLPVAAALAMLLLPNATSDPLAQGAETTLLDKDQIKKSTQALRDKIKEARLKADEKDLQEAKILFDKLNSELDKLNSQDKVDRKEALIKLNDLKKDLEDRKKRLGGASQMRQKLNQLKNLKKGPADKVAKALKDGDFKGAMDQLKVLQEKLENGQLNAEEKDQLVEQMKQMQEKMQQMVDAHEQAKRDLQEKIDQLERDGNLADAGKMQQKLDQLQMQDEQMNRIQQMANAMGNCQNCLKNGNGQQAAQQLAEMAGQLQEMQQEMDNLEAVDGELIDDLMAQIDQAKNAMNCQQCQGAGCEACQGQGMGQGNQQGNGLGEGQGQGARPEEETDSGFFESQVRGNVRRGEAVIAGTAGGPNVKGLTQEGARREVSESLRTEADPLTNQKLSRGQRDHAKQYFKQFRDGNE